MEHLFAGLGQETLAHTSDQGSWRLFWRGNTISQRSYSQPAAETYFNKDGRLKAFDLVNQQALPDADRILQRLLNQSKTENGPQHQLTISLYADLGILCLSESRVGEAEDLFRKLVVGRGNKFGFYHPITLDSALSLGTAFVRQGKYQLGEQMYCSILAGIEQLQQPEFKLLASTYAKLAYVLSLEDKFSESETSYEQAQAMYKVQPGQRHPDTQAIIMSLFLVKLKLSKRTEAQKVAKNLIGNPLYWAHMVFKIFEDESSVEADALPFSGLSITFP